MQGKPLPDPPGAAAQPKRGGAGPRAVGEMTERLTRRPLGKRGFAAAALIAEWPAIVGAVLAATTLPLKIAYPPGERAGGGLHIRVASGAMATQLAHLEPLLLQRINGHFGYGAVARLVITQGPVPRRPPRRIPAEPCLDAQAEAALGEKLATVEDPELKAALASLGRHLAARR